jgi:hypothetical protein
LSESNNSGFGAFGILLVVGRSGDANPPSSFSTMVEILNDRKPRQTDKAESGRRSKPVSLVAAGARMPVDAAAARSAISSIRISFD